MFEFSNWSVNKSINKTNAEKCSFRFLEFLDRIINKINIPKFSIYKQMHLFFQVNWLSGLSVIIQS